MELMLLGRNDEESRSYVLANGETVIGRKPDCDIVLNAPSIAARHARVFSVDEQAIVYGISPEWAVYVNGEPVSRRILKDGDSIELAHYRLRFLEGSGSAQADANNSSAAAPPHVESATEDAPGDAPEIPSEIDVTVPLNDSANDSAQIAVEGSAEISASGSTEGPVGDSGEISPETPSATPSEEPEQPPDLPAPVEATMEDSAAALPPSPFHLDILSGINQGRRVTLTRNRVVLGFDRQRLVEIMVNGDELALRTTGEDVEARLNDEPITDSFTGAVPGDVLWLRRISMRIHQD
jgi:pSer/pThr/pTyr-binding forkhead associated (FHA) protein